MKYIISALILLSVVTPAFSVDNSQFQERLGIDPVLHGIWMIHQSKTVDEDTFQTSTPPVPLLRASASKIVWDDMTEEEVSRVLIVEDPQTGAPGNLLNLNDRFFYVSELTGTRFFVLIVYRYSEAADTYLEHSRYIISVD